MGRESFPEVAEGQSGQDRLSEARAESQTSRQSALKRLSPRAPDGGCYDPIMKRAVPLATVAAAAVVLATTGARADDSCLHHVTASQAATVSQVLPPAPLRPLTAEETAMSRARELLERARRLDDAAIADAKAAADLAARLPELRTDAKAARDRANRADRGNAPDREILLAKAEDREAELAVSELEVSVKKRSAEEDRRVAHDLRQRAIRLVHDAPSDTDDSSVATCDPPFRYTSDGRKIYRVECLK